MTREIDGGMAVEQRLEVPVDAPRRALAVGTVDALLQGGLVPPSAQPPLEAALVPRGDGEERGAEGSDGGAALGRTRSTDAEGRPKKYPRK